jgi:hypothetical protein
MALKRGVLVGSARTYDFLDSIFGKSKFIEKTRFKKKRDFLGKMP